MGMGLCVAFIAFVRLPSLKVSTLLLTGLLVYDVFWVFFSSYIFRSNVMVRVATRSAENPVGLLSKRLHMHHLVYSHRHAPKLSLPGKLVFPSINNNGHFSMLGLGDIVMPGLLLCFVLRYDAYKRTMLTTAEAGVPPPNHFNKITYFHCSLVGYFFGKNLSNSKIRLFFLSCLLTYFFSHRFANCHHFFRNIQSCTTCPAISCSIYTIASVHNGLH